MTDFVYPAYFEAFHKAGSVPFDHLKKVKKPFQILSGGYQIIFKNGKWSQVFGSASKKKRFALEDRRGHRSEQRGAKPMRRASQRGRSRGRSAGADRCHTTWVPRRFKLRERRCSPSDGSSHTF